MRDTRNPERIGNLRAARGFDVGLGMMPSTWDIFRSLSLTMGVFLVGFGGSNLLWLAAGADPSLVRRAAIWNLIVVGALVAVFAAYRVAAPSTWTRSRGLGGAGVMEPPYRVRVKTAPRFVPSGVQPKDRVIEEFDRLQGELARLLPVADRLDLRDLKVRSAFNPRVRYNLYSSLKVLAAHQRRHLWQAERALERVVQRG